MIQQKGFMYICPQCNQPVPNPVERKCPRGHLLYDRHLLGSTQERSFGASFFNALIACVVIFLATTAALALLKKPGSSAGYILVAFIVAGILVLFRGLKEKTGRRGRPARAARHRHGRGVHPRRGRAVRHRYR
jgi:hypothetical protein